METASKSETIPALTGLRGVAALGVVTYHFSNYWAPAGSRHSASGPAYLGVDLFFVLSGFLMGINYGTLFQGGWNGDGFRTFLRRRFERIYPLYFLLIALAFLLQRVHQIGGWTKLPALISDILLLQSTGLATFFPQLGGAPIGPSWSISTELVAYLLLPLLVAIVARGGRWREGGGFLLSLLGLIAVSKLSGGGYRGPLDLVSPTTFWPVLRCVADFTIGLCAWRFRQRGGSANPLGFVALGAIALGWTLPQSDCMIVAFIPLLILSLCNPAALLSRVLSSPVAIFLGEASFALYLIHNPSIAKLGSLTSVIRGLHLPAPAWSSSIALIAVDVMAAYVLFLFVEKPARKWLRARAGRPSGSIRLEPSAP